MSTLKAFRLPDELAQQLSQIAEQTHRSEKFFVVEALTKYFEDFSDAQIAKDRFNDPNTKIIDGKEMRKRLGL